VTDEALRHAVLDQLDRLDLVATEGEPEALLAIARSELYRLSASLRALLDEHRPDENGRCRVCPGTLRGRRWPCTVWVIAHRQLLSGRTEHPRAWTDPGDRPREPEHTAEVPVVPTAIVSSSDDGPSDWDTEEFPRPDLTTDGLLGVPPVGGHLETDHTKIYRASVAKRSIR
jgi:hypothetical protein